MIWYFVVAILLNFSTAIGQNILRDWSFEESSNITGQSPYWSQNTFGTQNTISGFICSQEYHQINIHNCSGIDKFSPGPKTGTWFLWFRPTNDDNHFISIFQRIEMNSSLNYILEFYLQINAPAASLDSEGMSVVLSNNDSTFTPFVFYPENASNYSTYQSVQLYMPSGRKHNYRLIEFFYISNRESADYFIDDLSLTVVSDPPTTARPLIPEDSESSNEWVYVMIAAALGGICVLSTTVLVWRKYLRSARAKMYTKYVPYTDL